MIIEIHARIGSDKIGRDQHIHGAAEFQQHVTWPGEAGRKGGGDVIGSPATTGMPAGRPRSFGGLRSDPAEQLMRDGLAAEVPASGFPPASPVRHRPCDPQD